MPDNQFINLEELSKATQALLLKINEQSNLKVNKENVRPIVTSGTKIAEIEETEIYAPAIDTSNLATRSDLDFLLSYVDQGFGDLAQVASSGSYNDLTDTPTIPDTSAFMVKGTDYVTAGQKSGTTLGTKATAEGSATTASGNQAHAEGYNTIASGNQAHAEGLATTASGFYAHAEGANTTASGSYAHAEGFQTIAQRLSQHVFGRFNIADTSGSAENIVGTYVEIVGNGTSSTRSNARTLDWDGNEVLAGKLTVGTAPVNNMDVTTKQYVDNKITSDIATAIGNINQFEVAIISDFPTSDIDTHTIYFKSNSSAGTNVYDEYMYINNQWELIGSTQIDLSNYRKVHTINLEYDTTNDAIVYSNSGTFATEVTAYQNLDYDLRVNYNSDTYYFKSYSAQDGAVFFNGDQILTLASDNSISLQGLNLDVPTPEADIDVEAVLDSFELDYTSTSSSPSEWQGGSY